MLTPAASPPSRGFSLVELLVTLSVLAFLMMVGMPSLSQWTRNTQIRTVAESLANGISKARTEALRRNTPVRFSLVNSASSASCALSSTSGSWVVSLQSPAGNCDEAVSETSAPMILERWAQTEGSSNVTVQVKNTDCSADASTNQIVFDGFGRINATAVTPVRCLLIDHSSGSGNRALRLTVSLAGGARLCDPAVTDTKDPRRC